MFIFYVVVKRNFIYVCTVTNNVTKLSLFRYFKFDSYVMCFNPLKINFFKIIQNVMIFLYLSFQ